MSVGALLVPDLPGGRPFGVRDLVGLARRAEALGLARTGVSDHLLHRAGAFDPVAVLGALAAATECVRLESAVLQLPLRHPVQVAQSFATLDHLSGGRIELGVGVGGEDPAEYHAVGLDPRRRGQRWDGIFLDAGQFRRRAAELDERAAAHARTVGKGLVAWACVGERAARAQTLLAEVLPAFYGVGWERLDRYALSGDPAHCAERLSELQRAGAETFLLIPVGEPEGQLEAIAETARLLQPETVGAAG